MRLEVGLKDETLSKFLLQVDKISDTSPVLKYLDTKWFPYEHEGKLGRARLIWADSLNQWSGRDSILCDHYRFDIEITDTTRQVKTSDYFMNNIIRSDCVREIWVSREIPKNIIAAKVSIGSIPIIARIQIDKGS